MTVEYGWRTTLVLDDAEPGADNLCAWVDRPEWAERLRRRFAGAEGGRLS